MTVGNVGNQQPQQNTVKIPLAPPEKKAFEQPVFEIPKWEPKPVVTTTSSEAKVPYAPAETVAESDLPTLQYFDPENKITIKPLTAEQLAQVQGQPEPTAEQQEQIQATQQRRAEAHQGALAEIAMMKAAAAEAKIAEAEANGTLQEVEVVAAETVEVDAMDKEVSLELPANSGHPTDDYMNSDLNWMMDNYKLTKKERQNIVDVYNKVYNLKPGESVKILSSTYTVDENGVISRDGRDIFSTDGDPRVVYANDAAGYVMRKECINPRKQEFLNNLIDEFTELKSIKNPTDEQRQRMNQILQISSTLGLSGGGSSLDYFTKEQREKLGHKPFRPE